MTHAVLVWPPGRLETESLIEILRFHGIAATSQAGDEKPCALVVLELVDSQPAALPWSPEDIRTVIVRGGKASRAVAQSQEEIVSDEAATTTLLEAVNRARVGKVVPPDLDAEFDENPASALGSLTERECEVAKLVARGLRNEEVAVELGISYHTVRTHVQNVLVKLKLPHRQALAAFVLSADGREGGSAARSRPGWVIRP